MGCIPLVKAKRYYGDLTIISANRASQVFFVGIIGRVMLLILSTVPGKTSDMHLLKKNPLTRNYFVLPLQRCLQFLCVSLRSHLPIPLLQQSPGIRVHLLHLPRPHRHCHRRRRR